MRFRIALVAVLAIASMAVGQVKISQVHAQSSVFNRDYVELINTSGTPVSLAGWRLHAYWWPVADSSFALSGVIPPHSYFLVSVPSTGGGTGSLPVTPDLSGALTLRADHMQLWLNRSDPYPTAEDSAVWYNQGQPYYALPMNGTNALVRAGDGCVDSDVGQWDFDLAAPSPRNSSVTHTCTFVGPDCNRNGRDDRDEIIDDPTLDCDGDGHLDSCGGYVGQFPDCDQNGAPDCQAIRNGAPDANNNRRPDDTCEQAAVIAGTTTVTVTDSGVSADTSSWRAAGVQAAPGPAFAVVRWNNAAIRQAIGYFGYGYYIPYLDLREIGASDTAGLVDVFYTHNDIVALTPGSASPTYADLETIFGDRELLTTLDFRPHALGSEHAVFLSTSIGCPSPPGSPTARLMQDINEDAVTTLVLVARAGQAGATFAGAGNAGWPGARLVFFPRGPFCGSADFNGDGDTGTDADIYAFFACIAGDCCPTCGCADYNQDGDVGTDADIEAFFRVLAGSPC
jgi:hypothetical protein